MMEKINTVVMSKRAFVRIISFLTAAAVTMGALVVIHSSRADSSETQLQYSYMRAAEDLSLSLDNIKTALNKGLYANSPEMMTRLSEKLWSEAANAKAALAQLPVEELNLEQTYKFLSQVGNYSQSLSRKVAMGEELNGNERDNLKTLYSYAEALSEKMWKAEKLVEDGEISFSDAQAAGGATGGVSVTEGFLDFEEEFSDYPTLIYDGPFSDHIMEKDPLMLEGEKEISAEQALAEAIKFSGTQDLSQSGEEGGKMPSYVFESGDTTVAVTKQGGFFSYMLKYRNIEEERLGAHDALEKAKEYMSAVGMEDVEETYYEISGGVCIYNFAGKQDDSIILYTDLIKVGVALDNGEIMSFDARGYLTNHTRRDLNEPQLSEEDAASKLSSELNIKSAQLCVIPDDGMNEKYCYEFYCSDSDGKQILVYLNADTGAEEQILLLQISGKGKLTV